MSDELIENDTPPAPVTRPRLNPAPILAILLVLGALGFCGYIYSFWLTHNTRVARLKARNGDFVQLQHRGDFDEFAPPAQRARRNREADDEESSAADPADGASAEKPKPAEPNFLEKYINDMKPLPIQVVYWKDPELRVDDVSLILEFSDLEVLSIKCDKIDGKAIEKFLNLPSIRRVSVQAKEIDVAGIESWASNEKLVNLKLINTDWSSEDIGDIEKQAKANPKLKGKMSVTSVAGPSFGGM
ncbi:MAG: hypothetical protein ACK5OB_16300 [Pirellula sp.]